MLMISGSIGCGEGDRLDAGEFGAREGLGEGESKSESYIAARRSASVNTASSAESGSS